MCGGVSYNHYGDNHTVYFPNPMAQLPVAQIDGKNRLVAWGRRKEQPGSTPMGGWARHESILVGKWDKYFPTPVKIMVTDFMEKDYEGRSIWYPVTAGQVIQGLLAKDGTTLRVYVVTIESSFDLTHDRMPRLMGNTYR